MSRTVIHGGLVVTASDEIHATGKCVIPGGVDVHTRREMPFGGTYAADTFETGTRAAARGCERVVAQGDGPAGRGGRHLLQGVSLARVTRDVPSS